MTYFRENTSGKISNFKRFETGEKNVTRKNKTKERTEFHRMNIIENIMNVIE